MCVGRPDGAWIKDCRPASVTRLTLGKKPGRQRIGCTLLGRSRAGGLTPTSCRSLVQLECESQQARRTIPRPRPGGGRTVVVASMRQAGSDGGRGFPGV